MPTGEVFGAGLLTAPLPAMPVGTADSQKWASLVLSNRKLTISGFKDRQINSDAFNDVLAVKLALESRKVGDSLSHIKVRSYEDYFADTCKDDPATLKFIADNSEPGVVGQFDNKVLNIRNLLAHPLTEDSIQRIKNGLREIYVVIYGREPSHF